MIEKNLKVLRAHLHLSQTEFGRKLGVSRDVINNIECGRVKPKEVFLIHICMIYGVKRSWLENGQGDIFDEELQIDKELTEAMDIFTSLDPKLKEYALDQIRGLLKLQRDDKS